MTRIRRFMGLPPGDRRPRGRTMACVVIVRICLWVVPFSKLQRLLRLWPRFGGVGGRRPPMQPVTWAVTAVSRVVPRATCLTQALAAQALLRRSGYPARVRIGVTKDIGGRFEAHTWLESMGSVVLGGSEDVSRFTACPPSVTRRLRENGRTRDACQIRDLRDGIRGLDQLGRSLRGASAPRSHERVRSPSLPRRVVGVGGRAGRDGPVGPGDPAGR